MIKNFYDNILQGKTWLTAIFCVVRAILFPGTKIVIASGTKAQAGEIIGKIDELRKESSNLSREIKDLKNGANEGKVDFYNGSWIQTVASNDNARSKRANLLIVDEFRMVDLDVVTKVLRKFLTAPRQPKFLEKEEYKHLQERNIEVYMSSAWFKFHWSYDKLKAFFKKMVSGESYFVVGLPYQLSVSEGLLMEEQVKDEMSEDDFDPQAWEMEMECMWFGENEKAFFRLEDFEKVRKVKLPLYLPSTCNLLSDKNLTYQKKLPNEIRILTSDIAMMPDKNGKKNDASVYTVIRLLPYETKQGTRFLKSIEYMESMIGGHTAIQALKIRKLFDELDCDYCVLDTQSAGMGIFDSLVMDLYDKDTGITYEAWSCINDEVMAQRCQSKNAPKVIYSVKAVSKFNSDIAHLLRNELKKGKVRMLVNEISGQETLKKMKGWDNLSAEDRVELLAPYHQIKAFINETINLENKGDDNIVKLKENAGARKDRYSSVAYGIYILCEIERSLTKKVEKSSWEDYFIQGGGW